MRFRLGASGAEKLCASAPLGASARPLNFTLRSQARASSHDLLSWLY